MQSYLIYIIIRRKKRGKKMDINLIDLYTGRKKEILIDEKVNIDKKYYENSDVKDIKDVVVKGRFFLDYENVVNYELDVKGTFLLEDAISLEEVEYPFTSQIEDHLEENSKKIQNSLDLIEILWENIVLEVPLKFSKVEDLSQYKGEGWKMISEDDLKLKNNPFADL